MDKFVYIKDCFGGKMYNTWIKFTCDASCPFGPHRLWFAYVDAGKHGLNQRR